MSTRAILLQHGLTLARAIGYDRVSRSLAAEAAGVSQALVSYYWPSGIEAYHAEIMESAVAAGDLEVVAQGLVAPIHPVAAAAPVELRRAAAALIVGEG